MNILLQSKNVKLNQKEHNWLQPPSNAGGVSAKRLSRGKGALKVKVATSYCENGKKGVYIFVVV